MAVWWVFNLCRCSGKCGAGMVPVRKPLAPRNANANEWGLSQPLCHRRKPLAFSGYKQNSELVTRRMKILFTCFAHTTKDGISDLEDSVSDNNPGSQDHLLTALTESVLALHRPNRSAAMSADPLGGGHWEGQEEDQEHDLLTSAAADPFFGSRKRPGAELRGVAPAAKRQAAATPAAATTVGYPEWDLFAFAEWVSKFEYAAGINSSRVRLTKYVPHLRSRRLDRTGLRTPEAAVTGICTAILKRQAEALTSLPPGKSCMCEKELTAWSCSILSRRQGRRPDVPEDVGFERTSSRLRGRGRSPGHCLVWDRYPFHRQWHVHALWPLALSARCLRQSHCIFSAGASIANKKALQK